MPVRTASAVWEGTLARGKGWMRFGTWEGPYSAASRFEEGAGTNPEELIGAAHSGCFSMALALLLEQSGYKPERIETSARVTIERVGPGFKITSILLDTAAQVAGLDEKSFQAQADEAKRGCPVSQALTGTEVKVRARLL